MEKTKLISFTDSFHQAWRIWIEHFLKFTGLTTVIIFTTYLFSTTSVALLNWRARQVGEAALSWQSGVSYFIILAVLAILFVQFWGVIALYLLALKHGELSFHEAVLGVKKFFWDFVFLTILEIILSFLAALIGYFLVTIVGAILGLVADLNSINTYYNWLLIFPAFTSMVLANYLVFAAFCLLEKNLTAWQAIKQSFNLVRGRFWAILFRLLVASALVAVVVLLLGFVPWIGYALSGIILIPPLIIYTYVIYEDIKKVKPKNAL